MDNLIYETLVGTEIRLLKVCPGEIGDPINCEIKRIPLDTDPKYIALSYVWGGNSTKYKIDINNRDFSIGENLYFAIDQLRHYNKKFVRYFVWIDAICINQNDTAEKSKQVGRMLEIYARAHSTIAWLGRPEPVDEPY
ncbi:heterokaryon incompatibility protein-domain-containing protein [Camillea tinctor]|nr:heterokaryon incompatibility protein-domain-containing protein [Camillea tinctor]